MDSTHTSQFIFLGSPFRRIFGGHALIRAGGAKTLDELQVAKAGSKRHAFKTRYLLNFIAAGAAVSLASPVVARDSGPYMGIEGGISLPGDLHGNASVDAGGILNVCLPGESLCEEVPENFDIKDAHRSNLKRGEDVRIIAGYDFGRFRIESELGWKRAKRERLQFNSDDLNYISAILHRPSGPLDPGAPGMPALTVSDLEGQGGKVVAKSAMVNLLVDIAEPKGISFFGGGGFGRTWANALNDSDSAWTLQGIAGVRTSINQNVELGLKYRYTRTGSLNFVGAPLELPGNPFIAYAGGIMFVKSDSATIRPQLSGPLRTQSLLATLTYNFGPRTRD